MTGRKNQQRSKKETGIEVMYGEITCIEIIRNNPLQNVAAFCKKKLIAK